MNKADVLKVGDVIQLIHDVRIPILAKVAVPKGTVAKVVGVRPTKKQPSLYDIEFSPFPGGPRFIPTITCGRRLIQESSELLYRALKKREIAKLHREEEELHQEAVAVVQKMRQGYRERPLIKRLQEALAKSHSRVDRAFIGGMILGWIGQAEGYEEIFRLNSGWETVKSLVNDAMLVKADDVFIMPFSKRKLANGVSQKAKLTQKAAKERLRKSGEQTRGWQEVIKGDTERTRK